MTKKDLKMVLVSSTVGIGGIALLWWFARKTRTIPVLSPTIVKWELQ